MLSCSILSQRTRTVCGCRHTRWQQNVPTDQIDQALHLQLKAIFHRLNNNDDYNFHQMFLDIRCVHSTVTWSVNSFVKPAVCYRETVVGWREEKLTKVWCPCMDVYAKGRWLLEMNVSFVLLPCKIVLDNFLVTRVISGSNRKSLSCQESNSRCEERFTVTVTPSFCFLITIKIHVENRLIFDEIIGSRALSFSGPLLSLSVNVCLSVCQQLWGQISRKRKELRDKLLWGAYRKVVGG